MKLRETALALTAAGALAACSGGGTHESGSTTHSPAATQKMIFLANAKDSDVFQAVNCDSADPDFSHASETMGRPSDGAEVTLTLGDTDHNPNDLHNPQIKFLGGVSIYEVGGPIYEVVTSDPANAITTVDLDHQNGVFRIPIRGKNSSVAVILYFDSDLNEDVAAIDCVDALPPVSQSPLTDV